MIRKMGEFDVIQRTNDGYFNATALIKQWNEINSTNKELKEFLSNKTTKEFIEALREEIKLHISNSKRLKSAENTDSSNGGNSPYLTTRGNSGVTWMHPYLFIDYVMWISPIFKIQILKFVNDQLIHFRHLAGDNYRPFCSAISMIDPNCDFSEPAKWLNFVVFNSHQRDIRNTATQEQLLAMHELEKKYSSLIFEGYITDVKTLKEKLRAEWKKRHAVVPLELVG